MRVCHVGMVKRACVACTYNRACVWCIGMGGYACVSCRHRSSVHVWRVSMIGHACGV